MSRRERFSLWKEVAKLHQEKEKIISDHPFVYTLLRMRARLPLVGSLLQSILLGSTCSAQEVNVEAFTVECGKDKDRIDIRIEKTNTCCKVESIQRVNESKCTKTRKIPRLANNTSKTQSKNSNISA